MITQSEIRKEANKIIDTVFKSLKTSENKELWRKAIDVCVAQADTKDHNVHLIAIGQREGDADHETRQHYIWSRARHILANKFGKKFIKHKTL